MITVVKFHDGEIRTLWSCSHHKNGGHPIFCGNTGNRLILFDWRNLSLQDATVWNLFAYRRLFSLLAKSSDTIT